MAARDALSKLMNVSFSSKPLQWSEQSKDFKLSYERQNQSINGLLKDTQNLQLEEESTNLHV
jgi:hypothetical protein